MSESSDDADTIVPSSLEQCSLTESTQTIGTMDTARAHGSLTSGSVSDDPDSASVQFEAFSKLLCAFSFDEAKSLAEKQAAQKNMDTLRASFFHISANIAVSEKQYMNLSFLAPKGFLRKESNLRNSLEHLKLELHKFTETDLEKYATELIFFISIRMDQMEFYEKLSLLGSAKNVEIEDLISDYEMLTEKFKDRTIAVAGVRLGFAQIFTSIGWEIESLAFLLKSHSSMQTWNFFSSVIYSQEAHKRLSAWAEFLQQLQSSKKSSFLTSGIVNPSLYTWFVKLRSTQLCKFSLYFYDILAQYTNPVFDMKVVATKLQADYYNKIVNFVKRSDALAVCLIFDARETPFHPHGYSFPARSDESPTGLGSFPAVLAVPNKPATHWPSVVMLLNDHFQELSVDKLVAFFDTRAQVSYFLLKVDMLMYMLAIYEVRKSEKDSQITKFMNEMSSDLKCGKIFTSLKTIAK